MFEDSSRARAATAFESVAQGGFDIARGQRESDASPSRVTLASNARPRRPRRPSGSARRSTPRAARLGFRGSGSFGRVTSHRPDSRRTSRRRARPLETRTPRAHRRRLQRGGELGQPRVRHARERGDPSQHRPPSKPSYEPRSSTNRARSSAKHSKVSDTTFTVAGERRPARWRVRRTRRPRRRGRVPNRRDRGRSPPPRRTRR